MDRKFINIIYFSLNTVLFCFELKSLENAILIMNLVCKQATAPQLF